jgi:hypothetical protein
MTYVTYPCIIHLSRTMESITPLAIKARLYEIREELEKEDQQIITGNAAMTEISSQRNDGTMKLGMMLHSTRNISTKLEELHKVDPYCDMDNILRQLWIVHGPKYLGSSSEFLESTWEKIEKNRITKIWKDTGVLSFSEFKINASGAHDNTRSCPEYHLGNIAYMMKTYMGDISLVEISIPRIGCIGQPAADKKCYGFTFQQVSDAILKFQESKKELYKKIGTVMMDMTKKMMVEAASPEEEADLQSAIYGAYERKKNLITEQKKLQTLLASTK